MFYNTAAKSAVSDPVIAPLCGWVHLHICLPFLQESTSYDFLLAFRDDKAIPKWGLLLKKKNCSHGSKLSLSRVDAPFELKKGGKLKIAELLLLKTTHFPKEQFDQS